MSFLKNIELLIFSVLGINNYMKNVIFKDKKKRNLNYKAENSLLILKHLAKNQMLETSIRLNAVLILFNFSLNNFKHRVTNRCIITNRKSKIRNNLKVISILKFSTLYILYLKY